MDTDLFTASERLIQEHVKKHKNGSSELKDLIQQVLHHPILDPDEVDHESGSLLHERLVSAIEAGDIEVIDLGEEGDCNQDDRLYKRPALKVLQEILFSDERLAGHQHFGFKEYKNSEGSCILAWDANVPSHSWTSLKGWVAVNMTLFLL